MRLRADNCNLPVVVGQLVGQCFERLPSERPSFVEIVNKLKQALKEMDRPIDHEAVVPEV